MSTKTSTFKTPFTVVDFAHRTLQVFGSKPAAVKFAIAQDAEFISNAAGNVVWANPAGAATVTVGESAPKTKKAKPAKAAKVEGEKRVYNRATRTSVQPESAITGRFELEYYGKGGETKYAERPDAILRAMLGIKWKELWALGYTQKASSKTLDDIASGRTTADALRAEALTALDIMDPSDI